MILEDFFPPCFRDDCLRANTEHRDILPHQRELIESPSKYLYLQGGYGAGKTLPAAVLGVLLSLKVPGNMGIVLRRSYPKLHDSTQRIFLEVLQRAGVPFTGREQRDGWPHRIILANGSEVAFRETKDPGRFLGPEYGWFFMDEASEEPKKLFTDLAGRLRLPQARKYLKGILTSNPPHHNHWLADLFGTASGVREVIDPISGRTTRYQLWKVSSRANPFLPPGYLSDLMANNSPAEVQRIVEGEYGFAYEGKPVYAPPFEFSRHVGRVEALPISLVRSWDFGYHCPAITWHQFPQCKIGGLHWRIVHEYIGRDLESEQLATVVLDATRRLFPQHRAPMVLDCGDAAGAQVGEAGPGPITRLQRPPHLLRFRFRHLPNVDPGVALIRLALSTTCRCGQPVLRIAASCRNVIDGFAGGYHYSPLKRGEVNQRAEKPYKDGYYDNVMDTVRYAAENVYRQLSRDPALLDALSRDQTTGNIPTQSDRPWAWMEPKTTMDPAWPEVEGGLMRAYGVKKVI